MYLLDISECDGKNPSNFVLLYIDELPQCAGCGILSDAATSESNKFMNGYFKVEYGTFTGIIQSRNMRLTSRVYRHLLSDGPFKCSLNAPRLFAKPYPSL